MGRPVFTLGSAHIGQVSIVYIFVIINPPELKLIINMIMMTGDDNYQTYYNWLRECYLGKIRINVLNH